jgi:hypothetical protein
MAKKPTKPPSTSDKVKHLGGVGMQDPKKLTPKQAQTLAASVESHIQPRGKDGKPKKK